MASMIERIKEYFRSEKGHQAVERAKTAAKDPRNRQRLRRLMDQWRGQRAGSRRH